MSIVKSVVSYVGYTEESVLPKTFGEQLITLTLEPAKDSEAGTCPRERVRTRSQQCIYYVQGFPGQVGKL